MIPTNLGDGLMQENDFKPFADITWGSHLCIFYETMEDVLDVVVPFLKEGLEKGDSCLWIVPAVLTEAEAHEALRGAMQDFERHLATRSIETQPSEKWYFRQDALDLQKVMNQWNEKLEQVLTAGYAGLRVAAGPDRLPQRHSREFLEYEKDFNRFIADKQLIILCTYPSGVELGRGFSGCCHDAPGWHREAPWSLGAS